MFLAIDNRTNDIILSVNVRDNYKDSYNKSLRFTCIGCKDTKCTFVNSSLKLQHFRHSYESNCNESKNHIEFNNKYYFNWFKLFKPEYRKPYWFNYKLEQISNEKNIIMIRYSHQLNKTIENIEKYSKTSKVIWILSLENRKFQNIFYKNNKLYINFDGSKNDIPSYDSKKSIVYLDTGFDYILRVNLDNYINIGQEIELISIKEFYEIYSELFIECPIRTEWPLINNILKEKYNDEIKNIIDDYNNEIKTILEYDNIIYEYFNKIYINKKNEMKKIEEKRLKDLKLLEKKRLNDRIREIMLKKNYKELTENEIMTEEIWTEDFVKWYYIQKYFKEI